MDCNNVNLKKGSKGEQVKELQKYLKFLGLYKREVDGDFGTYTETAVKKMQNQYGNSEDGVFGKKTCSKCGINGQDISKSIQTIRVDIFEDMKARFEKYNKENKKEAQICYVDFNNKYRYVSNAKMKDMIKRYETYIKEHNGVKPNFCYVNFPKSTTDGSKVAQVKAKLGDFSNPKELYNKLIGRGYIGYNNDIYDWRTTLDRITNRKGVNCSDACQFCYEVYTEMGYSCRYVHVMCKSGIGHILLDIKYPKAASSYTRIDPAAALSTSSRYSWGNIWCSSPRYVIGYNPGWLMTDDGIT